VLVEGPAGVGKTELAKAAPRITGARLIRLQCYEGLDESEGNLRMELQEAAAAHPRPTASTSVTGTVEATSLARISC